jgi:hypothetical protein
MYINPIENLNAVPFYTLNLKKLTLKEKGAVPNSRPSVIESWGEKCVETVPSEVKTSVKLF